MRTEKNKRILNRFCWLFCSLFVPTIALALAPQDADAGWDRDEYGGKYSSNHTNGKEVYRWINCNTRTISAALNSAKKEAEFGQGIRIVVTRTCNENVTIDVDGVTLEGGSKNKGTINGNVTVDGAQHVIIRNLHIENSDSDGVTVQRGAYATIENNEIRNNTSYGIQVWGNASADVIGNVIENNGTVANEACGVGSFWQSFVYSENNLISDNGYCGVTGGQNSFYRSGYVGEPPDSHDVIVGPLDNAVECYRMGLCEFRGNAEINGKVNVYGRSNFEVRNNGIINGDVELFNDSYARIQKTVTGNGTVICNDGYAVDGQNFYGCGESFSP